MSGLPQNRRSDLYRPAWVDVDLDALVANLRYLETQLAGAAVLAVVKADAYGHGAVPVAIALEQAGVEWFGVALLEEGAELRRAGVSGRILVLGSLRPSQLSAVLELGLTPCVVSLEQLRMWCEAAAATGPVEVHLKVDTGMHRLGVGLDELESARDLLQREPRVRLGGVMSHLAETTAPASPRNAEQERLFDGALGVLASLAPPEGLTVHLASSAAGLHRPSARRSLVRAGLALYGYDPSGERSELVGVMRVCGEVVHTCKIAAGERVGYGGTWTAPRASRLGVVPVGYADGYPWAIGGRGATVRCGSDELDVVASVNMDMMQVDLTGTTIGTGDLVTLMAGHAQEGPTADDLARLAGSTPYEMLCRFGLRLPRRFWRHGVECRWMAPRGGTLELLEASDPREPVAT